VGLFASSLTSLTANTTYYVKAYATNSAGTAYGNEITFKTLSDNGLVFNPNLTYGSQSDIEGNIYKTIQIGPQVWMAENLRTTKFNDGTDIKVITDNLTWENTYSPGMCWYNNNAATNESTYGPLYNWETVNNRKLCPTGWHVPTNEEWHTLLIGYLGGRSEAGGMLKETGTIHWQSPNLGAINSLGFTALPSGARMLSGDFLLIGLRGYWWTSSEHITYKSDAYCVWMDYNSSEACYGFSPKRCAFSVRCLKD